MSVDVNRKTKVFFYITLRVTREKRHSPSYPSEKFEHSKEGRENIYPSYTEVNFMVSCE